MFENIEEKSRVPNKLLVFLLLLVVPALLILLNGKEEKKKMTFNPLTPEEERVILHKGTERPFTGEYYDNKAEGYYLCKQCDAPLYRSKDKFDSHCGWPSFDDEIKGAVKRQPDADGMRTEILCANCGAHLGHVFTGEKFTVKNVRYCVNSISMDFVPAGPEADQLMATWKAKKDEKMEQTTDPVDQKKENQVAYFAGGCYWGTEYYLQQAKGVISTTVGFMGGHVDHPTYKQVCYENTGHAETVKVEFNPNETDYETLAKLFFEIHDPTQVNRQGPDIGDQYRSVVFYANDEQKQIAEKLIKILENKGYKVATEVVKADHFWTAEDYHQDYYQHNGKEPYCHFYTKRF